MRLREPLAPTLWPPELPRPSVEEIRDAVIAAMRLPEDVILRREGFHASRRPQHVLARQLIAAVCKSVRQMSTPEIAASLGVSSHSPFTGSQNWAAQFTHGEAGIAVHNAVIDSLLYHASREMEAVVHAK